VFYKHLRNRLKKSFLNTLFAKLDFGIELNKSNNKYIILIFYYFFKCFIIIYIVLLMP